jgi:peptide/nickel transport system substrate-binding protein
MKKLSLILAVVLSLTISGCTASDIQNLVDKDKGTETKLEIEQNTTVINVPVYNLDTFNPITTKSVSVSDCMQFVYEPLFDFNSSLEAQPVLAEGYSVSPDGLTYTISLKNDVLWHDNTPFGAKDVDYTVKAIQKDSVYAKNLQDVARGYTAGTDTYCFQLKKPVVNFIGLLNFPIIKDGTKLQIDNQYIPVGTGPYRYGSELSAKEISLEASDSWHGGKAKIQKVILQDLKDQESAVYAFEASVVDCITSKTVDLSQYTPKGNVLNQEYISNKLTFVGMNFYKQPLWGKSTRQALACLVDKDELVTSLIYGRGVAVDVPVNPSSWFYDGASRVYQKDANKAAELLGQDGWTLGSGVYTRNFNGAKQKLELEILVNSENREQVAIAESIASVFNENGIKGTVKQAPYADFTKLVTEKKFDLFVGNVAMAYNMDPSFLVASGMNYFTYSNSEMDGLLANIGKTQDKEEIKQYFVRFSEIFNDDVPFIPLFFQKDSFMCRKKLASDSEPTYYSAFHNPGAWHIQKK